MIFHMMYIKTTSFNLVIGHQALRVDVGIRFSKLHQLTSGFMNPLTDMRKDNPPLQFVYMLILSLTIYEKGVKSD